ncbi:MAG: hypothetical protein J07HB67_01319 [halophilic archaeon J07HB67]|nr:MAG: hypothetical protein J07HB67_01319 [halophilic archaeon J07HB67]
MARNESNRRTRTLARLRGGARLLLAAVLVVGLLTAQAGSAVATTDTGADTAERNAGSDTTCGFWSIVLDWLGLVDNGCVEALEDGMVGIGPP